MPLKKATTSVGYQGEPCAVQLERADKVRVRVQAHLLLALGRGPVSEALSTSARGTGRATSIEDGGRIFESSLLCRMWSEALPCAGTTRSDTSGEVFTTV